MVWFQCEDCGENLKKPKLPNHFRFCFSSKLSCIDCGEIFTKERVQSHTQCMTEAEKYGPKDQGRPLHCLQNGQHRPEKPKKNVDVDINVGLSSRSPWFCSLCQTQTTSQQTLLLHADGKKHRAKAKAFHAAKNLSAQHRDKKDAVSDSRAESVEEIASTVKKLKEYEKESNLEKKRKRDEGLRGPVNENEKDSSCNLRNGKAIEVEEAKEISISNTKSDREKLSQNGLMDNSNGSLETCKGKIKWKKLVTRTLKTTPDGVLKIKKLQKLVLEQLEESGVAADKSQLSETMMNKIAASSRFIIDSKRIRLVE